VSPTTGLPPLWAHAPTPYPRTLPLTFLLIPIHTASPFLYQTPRRHCPSHPTPPHPTNPYQTIRRHCPPHPHTPYQSSSSLYQSLRRNHSPFLYQSPRRHYRLRPSLLIKRPFYGEVMPSTNNIHPGFRLLLLLPSSRLHQIASPLKRHLISKLD
jgi:hypothetical protein